MERGYMMKCLIIMLFFIYEIIFLSIILIKYKNSNFKLNINLNTFYTILINLFLTNLLLGFQIYKINYHIQNKEYLIFNLFIYIFYIWFSLIYLMQEITLDITKNELKFEKSKNKSLSDLYDGIRGFKHDFDNIVNTIDGYIGLNDIQGLKNYYSEFKNQYKFLKNEQILNTHFINNPGIYNLILTKYNIAKNNGITVNFEIFMDFSNLNISIFEFSRILGILLDNAIEATKECKTKIINLYFRQCQNIQIISIENTYNDKNIDTKKIFDKNFTCKKSHSGFGLWEVSQIVKHNKNIVLNTTKNNEFFKQTLELYKKL